MSPPPEKTSQSRFRYRRYGVYDLTYEDTTSPPLRSRVYSVLEGFRAISEETPFARRLLVDAIKLAPVEFMAYVVTTMWQGVYSAINLYWSSVLFHVLGNGFIDESSAREVYWPLAISWISCALVNVVAGRVRAWSLEALIKRFRAHFIPQLIRASLRVDLLSIHDLYSVFPVDGRFGSEFPGGLFLQQLSQLVQYTLDLISQVFVLLHTISCKGSPEWKVLMLIYVARGLVWWLAPSNGIGCSAFIYWSNNWHFQKMKALFGLAFSTQYRVHLVLDGKADSISTEYNKFAERLGHADVLDPTPWCAGLSREWYWDFLSEITLDLPMVMYALMLPAYSIPLSIASMALLQQTTQSISLSIGRYAINAPSLLDVCSHAKRLYHAIHYQSTMSQGTEPFPCSIDSSYDAGMKIAFRHVSLRYPGSDHLALCNVSFEIQPGELVLVVGTNGSGKSSMLKLLARLFDPTSGEIFINDVPLVRYDMDLLRAAMTFQLQSAVVYPVTVRENIAFGLPLTSNIEGECIEEAARMGNCADWIAKLCDGYDTQLQPSFNINNGWMEGVYGYPSEALKAELARHNGHPVSISDGERQRLATARTFMRLHHDRTATRLVVVDEATSSLDPVAERNILTELLNLRAGKTTVVVTHRFHHLAHAADRILCMHDGRVVESGTHADLVRANGNYAALYHAQVERAG